MISSFELASCDVSLSYNSVGVRSVLEECGSVVGIGERLVLLWLKMSGERAVISTSIHVHVTTTQTQINLVLLNALKRRAKNSTGVANLLDP